MCLGVYFKTFVHACVNLHIWVAPLGPHHPQICFWFQNLPKFLKRAHTPLEFDVPWYEEKHVIVTPIFLLCILSIRSRWVSFLIKKNIGISIFFFFFFQPGKYGPSYFGLSNLKHSLNKYHHLLTQPFRYRLKNENTKSYLVIWTLQYVGINDIFGCMHNVLNNYQHCAYTQICIKFTHRYLLYHPKYPHKIQDQQHLPHHVK